VGLAGMALSVMSAAAGAMLSLMVTYQVHPFRPWTLGVALMIAAAAGFVPSSTGFGASRRSIRTNQNLPLWHVNGVDGQDHSHSEDEETRRFLMSQSAQQPFRLLGVSVRRSGFRALLLGMVNWARRYRDGHFQRPARHSVACLLGPTAKINDGRCR